MSERITGSPGQTDEFEQMLSRLKPQDSGISRDRLMFLAGRQDVLRGTRAARRWIWPAATAASWLMTAAVAGLWTQSLDEYAQSALAQEVQSGTVSESPERPNPELMPDGRVDKVAPSSETVSVAPAVTRPRAHETASERRSAFEFDDLPRLSLVGWQSWEDARRAPAGDEPSSPNIKTIVTQPATYASLMKLYLDDQSALGIEGDIL